METQKENRYAVVGLSCLIPDAPNIEDYWRNILMKKVSIRPLNSQKFKADLFYRPDLVDQIDKKDKSITNIACYFDTFDFKTTQRFKIPPAIAEHMEDNQHAALYVSDQLIQSGVFSLPDTERVSVVFGNGSTGEIQANIKRRLIQQELVAVFDSFSQFERLSPDQYRSLIENVEHIVQGDTIPVTEDTAPGYLSNLVAGRVSNALNFQGPSFTVDAACASALASVIIGIQLLESRVADCVICGAADWPIGEVGLVSFSAINALSPNGSFPFDERADGFVIGQGAGAVAVKRLEDAIAEQDQIYAVVTGYGCSSDGKGKYIAAPNMDGQVRAIDMAIRMAGYPLETIEMIEAHGTGTKVGDVVEVAALKNVFQKWGIQKTNYCGIGSVKSNIGHLKSAAGMAGLLKTILAIYHKILPPTASIKTVNPKLGLTGSPFYILTEAKSWPSRQHPRRANVSAFGFGGANYHMCIEEYLPEEAQTKTYAVLRSGAPDDTDKIVSTHGIAETLSVTSSASSLSHLRNQLKSISNQIGKDVEDTYKVATALNLRADASRPFRMAIVAKDPRDLQDKIKLGIKMLRGDQGPYYLSKMANLAPKGIYWGDSKPIQPAQTALMFPGQGSQYPGMCQALFSQFGTAADILQIADMDWQRYTDRSIASILFDPDIPTPQAEEHLAQTQNTHPAMYVCNYTIFRLLETMGLCSDYFVGHSLGEICAMVANGMLSFREGLGLIKDRGDAFMRVDPQNAGAMLSLKLSVDDTEAILEEIAIPVTIANVNAPEQTVISGDRTAIERAAEIFRDRGVRFVTLPVACGFHSRIVEPANAYFRKRLIKYHFKPGSGKVFANQTGAAYPPDEKGIKDLLSSQIISPLNFVTTIKHLNHIGVRLFVELGPGTVLSNLTRKILAGKSIKVIATNQKGADAYDSLLKAVAKLFAEGIDIKLPSPSASLKSGVATAIRNREDDRFRDSGSQSKQIAPKCQQLHSIAYSGLSIGLPGSYKNAFEDDNFERVFRGQNFIERLTDEEKERIVALRATRLNKSENGASFKTIQSADEVIQLMGKCGRLDLESHYGVDPKEMQLMTNSVAHAVAAGYETLRDAGIPLVQEYTTTATGALLPTRLALPKALQNDTGIIFATSFPFFESLISEVSRHVGQHYAGKVKSDLIRFYEEIIPNLSDNEARDALTNWFSLNYSRLSDLPGGDEIYAFNRDFINQIANQANISLARLLSVRGPSLMVSATCSSTCTAISMAEDMIKTGRAHRVLIVANDDATSTWNMPWVAAGFLTTGAATIEGDIYKAAVPFDRRRKGTIIGTASVGMLIETTDSLKKRGMSPICDLLGSHLFNTAGPLSQIDKTSFSEELEIFITRMEQQWGLGRETLAAAMVYMSHEPYSPAAGGCAQTEVHALEQVFQNQAQKILICNTKAATGHTMAASVEDPMLAKSLQLQRVPPVLNSSQIDADFSGISLSRGGQHAFRYGLRTAAGFGGHGNFILLRRSATSKNRTYDPDQYKRWLKDVTDYKQPRLRLIDRLLIATDGDQPISKSASASDTTISVSPKPSPTAETFASVTKHIPPKEKNTAGVIKKNPKKVVLALLSRIAKYPEEMLETDMELEADLGLDEDQQSTLWQLIGEKFGISRGDGQACEDDLSIGGLIDWISSQTSREDRMLEEATKPHKDGPKIHRISKDLASESPTVTADKREKVTRAVLEIMAEVTKYPEEMLELDMEMEADLGIDTVKQATILSRLGEKYRLQRDDNFQLSEHRTIGSIVDWVLEKSAQGARSSRQDHSSEVVPSAAISTLEVSNDTSGNQDPVYLSRETLHLVDRPLKPQKKKLTDKHIWILGHQVEHLKSLAKWIHPSNRVITHCWNDPSTPAEMNPDSASIPDLVIDVYDPLETIDYIGATADEVAERLQACSTNRFQFYKAYNNASSQYPARMFLLTMIDGRLGRDQSGNMVDPSPGALFGFYKSLQKEWDNQLAIIDLDPGLIQHEPNQCIDIIAAEVAAGMPDQEVAYFGSNRSVLKIQASRLEKSNRQAVRLNTDSIVLAAGGARGITAEIVKSLAERHGCNFILLGRTKLVPNVAELSEMSTEMFEKQRADILEKLKQKHRSVRPIMLEREFSQLKRSVEIHRNLQVLEQLGAKVRYYAVDVMNYPQLCDVVERAKANFGPINMLIHGAGVDRSRSIAQKSVEEFERIFQTKALGALNLTRVCVREPLQYVIGLASISGRFGNAAQSDYSAGNSFIDFWIDYARKIFPGVFAKSINWSGWAETGMAWNNDFVRTYSESSGIQFISVGEGQATFHRELSDPDRCSPVIVHKGLGPLPSPSQFKLNQSRFVMIDRIVQDQAGRQRAHRLLSVKRDLMLDQHRLQGTPLVPAVAYMEMCAEYYAYLTGNQKNLHFEDIRFDKALRLFNDKPVEAVIEPEWLESHKLRFRVKSLFKPRKLGMIEEINHCSMVVSQSLELQAENPLTWPVASEAGDETKSASFLETFIRQSRAKIDLGDLFLETEIYLKPQQRHFKDCLNGQMYTRCLPLSQLSNRAYPINNYLLNPCFLDTVFQAGGFYCTLKLKQMFLPWHIEKLSVLRVPRKKGRYWVYAQKVSETEDSFCLDIAVCNDQRKPCYIAKGAHFHKIAN